MQRASFKSSDRGRSNTPREIRAPDARGEDTDRLPRVRRTARAGRREADSSPWDRLVEIVGKRSARRISAKLKGTRITVPAVLVDQDDLRRQIRADLDCDCGDERHHSYRAVARRRRVSRMTVFRYGNPG